MMSVFRMINSTHFEVDNQQKKYGPSAIQPSVGDAGAPVFMFIGNYLLINIWYFFSNNP